MREHIKQHVISHDTLTPTLSLWERELTGQQCRNYYIERALVPQQCVQLVYRHAPVGVVFDGLA